MKKFYSNFTSMLIAVVVTSMICAGAATALIVSSYEVKNQTVEQVINTTGGTIGKGNVVVWDYTDLILGHKGVKGTSTVSSALAAGVMLDTVEDGFIGRMCTEGFCDALLSDYATAEATLGTGGTTLRGDSGSTGMGFILQNTAIGTLAPVYLNKLK